jgi:membrane fusion protein, multidrug efflux system
MRFRWIFAVVSLGVAVGGVAWHFADGAAPASAARGSRDGHGEGDRPVPVVAGVVGQRDVPIYLDAIGTVQAFNTVTVHVRVDGELQKVAFTEGQEVKAGDLLAQIDPRPYQATLDQAIGKKAQDEAQLANARRDLARYTDLRKEGNYATQQQLDTQRALVDQLAATIKSDQAAIDSAQVQLNYTTITSPLSGRVGIRQVDQGNIVHASDTNGLVVITQIKPISVVFTLPEQSTHDVLDQSSSRALPVTALDRNNSKPLDEGKLAVIDNQIDQTTGTIKLKATFANEKRALWPGQFVNVRLLLTTRKDGIVVPAPVVQRGPKGAFAFVITADEKVEVRPVKVAQIEDGEALIDEGLKPGERVVVDGQSRLQADSRVIVRDPNRPRGSGAGAEAATEAAGAKGKGGSPQ